MCSECGKVSIVVMKYHIVLTGIIKFTDLKRKPKNKCIDNPIGT